MNSLQADAVLERLKQAKLSEPELIKPTGFSQYTIDYQSNPKQFIEAVNEKGFLIDFTVLYESIEEEHFLEFVKAAPSSLVTFAKIRDEIIPVVIQKKEREVNCYMFDKTGSEEVCDLEYLEKIWFIEENGKIPYGLPYQVEPMVSDDDSSHLKKVTGPISRLFNLLNAEKRDILYIYFYSIIIALISLALPIGVQSIIEMISGGVIFNSIVWLIGFVIIAILIAGVLQVIQYSLVEVLERRIFVKAAFEFSFRIPKIRSEAILNEYAPELMNRFFDILTIQKGLPKLLIDVTGSALQIVFGIILLSFYHPFFVLFGIILMLTLTLVFYFTGPKGLKTSLIESKYKYKVAHWLEEVARTLYAFKIAGSTSLPMQKMDGYVNNYLQYRKKHFQVLMTQFISIVGFKTIVTGGLLIIGSYLVIDRQITLGQFVATEIVIILILSAVEKLILSLKTVYDVLTAVEKIGQVTDLKLERKGGIVLPKGGFKGMKVDIKNLSYKYPGSSEYAIKDINLSIAAGERICLAGYNSSGKNTLAQVITGLLESYEGGIRMNGISLRDINVNSMRDLVAKNVTNEDIFEGSILENISMGNPKVTYDDMMWALDNVGLADMVSSLPDGIMTSMVSGGKKFAKSVAIKLILARCIAEKPQLLILNDELIDLEKSDRVKILGFLMDKKNPWTLVCVSNDPMMLAGCNRVVILNEGLIVKDGAYKDLAAKKEFKDLLEYPKEEDLI
ncbi:peptidase domain-containing ABC transporter [Flexithrix dorotheae]|uniref:peptidase domain-containing ABC transporter n=1 Tax=Flexithrix dorotheae TaxID=70993 RepID=UPI00037D90DB|nr:ATP-binding cassette domain-containing protein [Flexithrix dorotheae]